MAKKKPKPNPEWQFSVRWLASKGLEISPDEYRRVEGKFNRKDLPPEDQRIVDAIIELCQKHYGEFLAMRRQAMKIKRQRLGR